jgi:ABC-type cobalt transport system substrate-binding protein
MCPAAGWVESVDCTVVAGQCMLAAEDRLGLVNRAGSDRFAGLWAPAVGLVELLYRSVRTCTVGAFVLAYCFVLVAIRNQAEV